MHSHDVLFYLPYQTIAIKARDAKHLLQLLRRHLMHFPHWALLRTPQHLIALSTQNILLFLEKELAKQAETYLRSEISELEITQVLLRLAENQKMFNHLRREIQKQAPMTHARLRDYVLSQFPKVQHPHIHYIIDQEYAKIQLNPMLLEQFLYLIDLPLAQRQRDQWKQRVLSEFGHLNYHPMHLAKLLLPTFHEEVVPSPSCYQLAQSLSSLARLPSLVMLGEVIHPTHDGSHKQLIIRYNFCSEQLEYYFHVGYSLYPIEPKDWSLFSLLLPQEKQALPKLQKIRVF